MHSIILFGLVVFQFLAVHVIFLQWTHCFKFTNNLTLLQAGYVKKHNSGERNVFVVVRGRFYLLKETHTFGNPREESNPIK